MVVSETGPQETMVLFDADGRIASSLFCRACGYNLRTLPIEEQCPQCARPVAESLAGALPVLDQTGCIVTDVPCVSCGYNLRTRPATSLCPECAAPVVQSLRGHYLNQAPPRWTCRVARGATLLLIAAASMIAMPLLAMCGAFLIGVSGGPMAAGPPIALGIVLWVLGLGFTVVLIWGLVYLTTPDPTMQFKREGLSARRLVRYCLLLLPVMIVGWIISTAAQGMFFSPFLPPLAIILSIVGSVAYLVIPLATLRHLAMLMRRVPRPGLVTFAKIEFWGLLITGGIYVCSVAVVLITTFWTMTPAMLAAMGPNTPTAGPNSPVAGPNSIAQLTKLGYITPGATPAPVATPSARVLGYVSSVTQADPNGRLTVTTASPLGVTTTTTMPASAPFPPGAMPGPALMIGSVVAGVGGCGMFGLGIAGFVLLILARNALAGAARQAESNALLISGATMA